MRCKSMTMFFVFLLTAQGCTNYLYTGKIDAKDSFGRDQKVVLYWTKTDPVLGSLKAGPATLKTQCSFREVSYVEKPDGIFFLGDPVKDSDAIHGTPISSQDHICGKFLDQKKFVDIQEGDLALTVSCEPKTNEFSVGTQEKLQGYIQASKDPYTFQIERTKKWNLFGEILEAPLPPPCQTSP